LRVSTYGRGIWEMPLPGSTAPDYTVDISNANVATFPGQSVLLTGSINKFNGYSGTVTLSCSVASQGSSGSVPATCAPSVIDANGNFSVNVSNPSVQDFSFRIQGTDGALVRQAAVTVRVVDFSLGAPSPSSISNLNHGDNASVQLDVTSLGSFDQTVTVDCDPATLPVGMTCSVAPFSLTPGSSTPVVVTINTTTTVAAGSSTPTIRAISTIDATHSIQHTQTISVGVVANAGFTLDTSAYTLQKLVVGKPLTTTVKLTPHDNGTNATISSVHVTCSAPNSGILATACGFLEFPNGILPISGNTPVALTLSLNTGGGVAGSQQIAIDATDPTNNLSTHAALPFTLSDFGFGTTQTMPVTAGTTATITYHLMSLSGYIGTLTLLCDTSAIDQNIPCTFTPASGTVQLAAGQTATVTASFAVPNTTTAASYPITLTAIDNTITSLQHSQTSSVQVRAPGAPDFNFTFASASITAKAGATISPIPLTLTPQNGFTGSVQWTVAGCPQLATCTVTPNPTIVGQSATLNLATTAPTLASLRTGSTNYVAFWISIPFGALGLVQLQKKRRTALMMLLCAILLGFTSCGGGGTAPPIAHPGTPAGTYTIGVTGTSGNIERLQTLTLTVQ
jgi:hypothetical protein